MGFSILIKKNKLHVRWIIREMNLLSLINSLLAYFITIAISANHKLIRIKKIVSQIILTLYF
jgi:hypothetical protein